jgi:hypothetical protein
MVPGVEYRRSGQGSWRSPSCLPSASRCEFRLDGCRGSSPAPRPGHRNGFLEYADCKIEGLDIFTIMGPKFDGEVEVRGGIAYRLNVELQKISKVYLGSMCSAVLITWDPATPLPPHLGSYMKALLVSQDRRHLFVTLWEVGTILYFEGRHYTIRSKQRMIDIAKKVFTFCKTGRRVSFLCICS